jgi:hypothetical protein
VLGNDAPPSDAGHVFLRMWTPIQRPWGAPVGNCWIKVAFRAPGDAAQTFDHYSVEGMEPINGSGIRQNAEAWVPVVDGKFEYAWTRSTSTPYPPGCSYGLGLELIGYARNK